MDCADVRTNAKQNQSMLFVQGGMRYHLLSLEDREDLGESSRPRRKKHDYRIALFGGSQPQSCRYFNPKVTLSIKFCSIVM